MDLQTVALVLLLIGGFIIAFKVMEVVFEMVMVSLLSGLFYVALWWAFSYPLSLQRVLTFSALGTILYFAYGFIASVYRVSSELADVPVKAGQILFRRAREIEVDTQKLRDRFRGEGDVSGEEADQDVKEVVLDNLKNKN